MNAEARTLYAKALCLSAHVRSTALEAAFGVVPRERFLGPPPWHVFGDFGLDEMTSDPAALYRDILVAIDDRRGINNGEPQLWALVFDRLAIRPGQRVLHVGAGTGYYTAILAELVGPGGHVAAVEIEPDLARLARVALSDMPQVVVHAQDASQIIDHSFDVIVFSCGVTRIADAWLENARQGMQIAAPFTGADHAGVFFLITRSKDDFSILPLCGVSIYPAAGFRRPLEEKTFDGVRRADREALWNVRRLRQRGATMPREHVYGFGNWVMTGELAEK